MSRVELPECVTRLLWDTEPRSVTWEAHRESVIGRVLAHGDWDAIGWLRSVAGDAAIRDWIVATRGRRLSRRQIRFWQLVLELPEDQVGGWLALPERQVWDDRCARRVDGGSEGFERVAPEDVGAMELSAITQRGARKDFFDLVALERTGVSLHALVNAYQRRFGVRDVAHVLTALTYFDDADKDTEPILGTRETWPAVKDTIRARVREFVGR